MNKDEFYLSFENKFRGTREDIINSLSNYDGSLNYCCNKFDLPKLLDIGCGRGEWLQKVKELGLDATGIEMNPRMVQACRDLKLEVLEGDAISLMNSFEGETFALISIFHVVEHLQSDYLDELLSQCKRLLSSEGLLIIETPSIDNLIVSSNRFYLDSTHITHINADQITFRLENLGFKSSRPYFINSGPLSNADNMNLTKVFNGISQDLCIISSLSDFLNDDLSKSKLMIEKSFELGLTTLKAASEFDRDLNILRNKVFHQNLEIFELRQNLIDLKKSFHRFDSHCQKIRNNLCYKLVKYIIKAFKKIKNICILTLRSIIQLIFNFSKKITPLKILDLVKKNQIFLSIFLIICRRLGLKSLTSKLITISSKTKSYSTASTKINQRLLKRYKESSNSKKIYQYLKN